MPKIIAQQHSSQTATARKGWAAAAARSAGVSAIAVGIDTPHDMAGSADGNKAAIRRKLHTRKSRRRPGSMAQRLRCSEMIPALASI
jgi:hypothetical protein